MAADHSAEALESTESPPARRPVRRRRRVEPQTAESHERLEQESEPASPPPSPPTADAEPRAARRSRRPRVVDPPVEEAPVAAESVGETSDDAAPARRRRTRREKPAESSDDEFGLGLELDAAPAARRSNAPRPKSTPFASTPAAPLAYSSSDSFLPTVSGPATPFVRPTAPARPAAAEESPANSTDNAPSDIAPSGNNSPSHNLGVPEQEGDGDGFKRRRRRRRRGGTQPGPQTPQPPQGHHQQQRPQPAQPQHQRNRANRQQRRQHPGSAAHPGAANHQNHQHQRYAPSYVSNEITGIAEGILELHPKGYGFLRDPGNDYTARDSDPFVSSTTIEKNSLREGVLIVGDIGPGAKGQGPRLKSVSSIDGRSVEDYLKIRAFDTLTPINPFEQIRLERGQEPVTMRVVDLLCPIGKGQRALIVAPPRSGKTMLLQDIADSVSQNHPEVHLIVLLIDERPEEVTEMQRRVKGEVVASSLDRDVESHVRISQLVTERAKRLAESGKDVFILLDSITRLARAFNKYSNSGRTGSGGLDIRALDIPKKMFGTARRFEEGGSLTVVGTALIETGGRMDDAIFQEFKGTGNMELVLSRELADRRIWPAIDIAQSGTRREEKILDPEVLEGATWLRRALITLSPVQAMDDLTRKLKQFPSNREFLHRIRQVL